MTLRQNRKKVLCRSKALRQMVQNQFNKSMAHKLKKDNEKLKREQLDYRRFIVDKNWDYIPSFGPHTYNPLWLGLTKCWVGYKTAKRVGIGIEIDREQEYASLIKKYLRLLEKEDISFDVEIVNEFPNVKKKLYED